MDDLHEPPEQRRLWSEAESDEGITLKLNVRRQLDLDLDSERLVWSPPETGAVDGFVIRCSRGHIYSGKRLFAGGNDGEAAMDLGQGVDQGGQGGDRRRV